jgi:DNA-binding response OmpR family regulator
MSKILFVEDDPVLGRGLSVNLELEGYVVTWARDLRTARRADEAEKFDLVVLDLGLPDGNGLSFCKQLRQKHSRIPIIILTAQTDEKSVVDGLDSGANDYVRKPFGPLELLARIRTALGEPALRDQQLRYGGLVVLVEQRRVFFEGKPLEMSPREFDILKFFVKNAESVISRERLIEAVDSGSEISDRTIDSHVSHVRKHLRAAGVEAVKITPVYGIGYRMEKK